MVVDGGLCGSVAQHKHMWYADLQIELWAPSLQNVLTAYKAISESVCLKTILVQCRPHSSSDCLSVVLKQWSSTWASGPILGPLKCI